MHCKSLVPIGAPEPNIIVALLHENVSLFFFKTAYLCTFWNIYIIFITSFICKQILACLSLRYYTLARERAGTMYDFHDSTDIFVNHHFCHFVPKRHPELALKTSILVPKVAYDVPDFKIRP